MAVNTELIDIKARKYMELRDDIRILGNQLKEDLIQLDRDAFNGLTWHEFLSSIDEEVKVGDNITIKRETYRITGIYIIDENVKLTVFGNIYTEGGVGFTLSIHYKESDRYVDNLPKKYEKQYQELVTEMKKYQVERPSDKYSKALDITSF